MFVVEIIDSISVILPGTVQSTVLLLGIRRRIWKASYISTYAAKYR